MPEYLSPKVYMEEVSGGIKPIEGVGTSTGAFIGVAERGPIVGRSYPQDGTIGRPVLVTSLGEFKRTFGGFVKEYLAYAVSQFFTEGGQRCYVARIANLSGIPAVARSQTTLQDSTSSDVLRVYAIDEGEWGDNISINVRHTSKYSTILDGSLTPSATQASLQSTEGVEVGSILGFADPGTPGTIISRVTVTRVAGNQIFFSSFDPVLTGNIADGAIVSAQDFALTVKYEGEIVETFENLSMESENATDYALSRINEGGARSRYIRVEDLAATGSLPPASTSPPGTPTAQLAYEPLQGGSDGAAETASDYTGNQASQTGFYAFDSVDDINILAVPGVTIRSVIQAGMTYCENRKDCFFVGDLPEDTATTTAVLDFKNATGTYAGSQALNSKYGALYWPWLRMRDPKTGRPTSVPPSGAVIGSYARTDVRRGVHKAAAGTDDGYLRSVMGIEKIVTKGEHDVLNPQGVNVIRSFPGLGIVIWGARTTSSDPEWRYVNVRRLFLFLEESIEEGTQWVVFEPNDRTLWNRIVRNVSAFLRIQWLEGKLVGDTQDQAFYVKCDEETNPPESVDLGRVITEIGVAPSKPAEFVIFRISQSRPGSSS